MTISNKKVLKKRIINIVFLLVLSSITILTYYTSNFSQAKDIIQVSVNVKNALLEEQDVEFSGKATKSAENKEFYIELPEYIANRKVTKYTYYTEETDNTSKTLDEENGEVNNAITEYDILPQNKIYLTEEEVKNKELIILATYDVKEKNDTLLYNQQLFQQVNDCRVSVVGYMPANAEIEIGEFEKKDVEEKIRKQTNKPIAIAGLYDIKIIVNKTAYEPYEFDENVKISMVKGDLSEEKLNIWHINSNKKAEKIENGNTSSFSLFALEDTELTATAEEALTENALEIDDRESDKNYYLGKNYTDDISGENLNTYTNLANVTINYYGYAKNELDAEKVGYISLTEKNNVVRYKKTCPVENGKITLELIDNPFMDKPTGYGFCGWTTDVGTITKDSNTNVQNLSMSASGEITLNVYVNWEEATVVYVSSETGVDDNDGLTPETAFGSWEKSMQYLEENTTDANDREKNIIVMTGNMPSSFNWTTPITMANVGDITYTSSTDFVSDKAYILATGTGANNNAITASDNSVVNTILSDTLEPSEEMEWIITSSGDGYSIRNKKTGYYLAYSNGLVMQSSSFTWNYSNRRFYYNSGNSWWPTSRYIRYNNGWTTTTSQNSATSFYFLTYTLSNPREERVIGTIKNNPYYTTSTNLACTITSLYNHTDYRNNATLDLTQNNYQDITIYNDIQMDYININASGYTENGEGLYSTSSDYPILYGNAHNVRIGRGMYPTSNTNADASTFCTVHGGTVSGNTGSTNNDNNAYRLVVESGAYSSIQAFHGRNASGSYYGTVYAIWGNDVDRVKQDNSQLKTYYRSTINSGSGSNGKSNKDEKAFLINVKSGTFGYDYRADNPNSEDSAYSGIYVGGYGTNAASNVRDISDRYIIVEGGNVANIIGGLKITNNSDVETRIYVKGGTVLNIVGGAGVSTTYEDRIIQVTGGTVKNSVSRRIKWSLCKF